LFLILISVYKAGLEKEAEEKRISKPTRKVLEESQPMNIAPAKKVTKGQKQHGGSLIMSIRGIMLVHSISKIGNMNIFVFQPRGKPSKPAEQSKSSEAP